MSRALTKNFDARIYEAQLFEQIRFALYGIELLDNEGDISLLGYHVQNILTAAGNISKILFFDKPRCKALRDKYKIANYKTEYPILSCVNVRNSCEHFDERLDRIFDMMDGETNFTLFCVETKDRKRMQSKKRKVLKSYEHSERTAYYLDRRLETMHSVNFLEMFKELQKLDLLIFTRHQLPLPIGLTP